MATRVVTVAAAAALAAALAVSACAPAVDGRAVAGETLLPSSDLKSAQLPATPAAVQQEWLDVTGQGTVLPRDSVDDAQFSATPVPGSAIWHAPATGSTLSVCTAGPTVTGPGGSAVLTAGHCGLGPRAGQQYTLTAADGDTVPLGTATRAADDNRGVDSTIIHTPAAAAVPPLIAGTWPVAGVLTVGGVESLPLGSPICYVGAITAARCGPLEARDDRGRLVFGVPSLEGDSGSAVFVLSDDGAATLVAILEGGDEVSTQATYLDPALHRLGAAALVDAAAHAAVAGLPGYSSRVTTG